MFNALAIDPSADGTTGIAYKLQDNYHTIAIKRNNFSDIFQYSDYIINFIIDLGIKEVIIENFINYKNEQYAFTNKENIQNDFIGRLCQGIQTINQKIFIHKRKAAQYKGVVSMEFLEHKKLIKYMQNITIHEQDAFRLLIWLEYYKLNKQIKGDKMEELTMDSNKETIKIDNFDLNWINENLKFEEKEHKYTYNNIDIPSVSTIMKRKFPFPTHLIPAQRLNNASMKGTWIHEAAEHHINNYDQGGINMKIFDTINGEDPIFSQTKLNCKALILYLDTLKIPESKNLCENKLMSNPALTDNLYAGTVDWIRIFEEGNYIHIIDFKTTSAKNLSKCSYQLSFYAKLLREVKEFKDKEIRISILLANRNTTSLFNLDFVDDKALNYEIDYYYTEKIFDPENFKKIYA